MKLPPPVRRLKPENITLPPLAEKVTVPYMCDANCLRCLPEQEPQEAPARPVRPTAPKYCLGLLGRACQFGEQGGAARLHGGQKCIFCDLTKLNQAFLEGPSSLAVRKRFNRLTPQAQDLALNRVSDPGYRQWLQTHRLVRNEAMSNPVLPQGPPENSSWKQTDPFTPSELAEKYRMAQALWSTASESRQGFRTWKASIRCSLSIILLCIQVVNHHSSVIAPSKTPTKANSKHQQHSAFSTRYCSAGPSRSAKEYRDKVVDDRRKSFNMMNIQVPRLDPGAEVTNSCPLPKAGSSVLTAQTQLWCEFNSWGICPDCQRLQPRDLTVQGFESLWRPNKLSKKCIFCAATKAVPSVVHPPVELRQLPPDVIAALCPLQVNYGPWLQAKDRFGRGNGYRLHGGMINFAWQPMSVEQQLQQLKPEFHPLAKAALQELLRSSGPRIGWTLPIRWVLLGASGFSDQTHSSDRTRTKKMASVPGKGRPRVCIMATFVPAKTTVHDVGTTAVDDPSSPGATSQYVGGTQGCAVETRSRRRRGPCWCCRGKAHIHVPCPVWDLGLWCIVRDPALHLWFGFVDRHRLQTKSWIWSPSATVDERSLFQQWVLAEHASSSRGFGSTKRVPTCLFDAQSFGMVLAKSSLHHRWHGKNSTRYQAQRVQVVVHSAHTEARITKVNM